MDLKNIPEGILADYLRLFYFEIRKNDGDFYSPSTFIAIRFSLQRYLASPDIRRNIDIIDGIPFKKSNRILKMMVGKYIKAGGIVNQTKQYQAIEKNDMQKMSSYFDRTSTDILQEEVWFSIVYYFGFRGREVIRDLPPKCFSFEKDSENETIVGLKSTYLSKNIKASLSKKEYENIKVVRMYEIDQKDNCPVEAMEIYFKKIPGDNLFPMPLKLTKNDKDKWFSGVKVLRKKHIR